VGAGAEELPDWWPGNEDPLVYLTFGSVAAGEHLPYYPALYRLAIEALSPLPVRVLVTVGDAARKVEELGKVPSNARVETWVAHTTWHHARTWSSATAASVARSARLPTARRS
jgi:UDP:flavonoid glycosyltransferase YjiC (YdhE family)